MPVDPYTHKATPIHRAGALILCSLLAIAGILAPGMASAKASALPGTKRTVTYCTPGGVPLAADVYTPKTPRVGMPLVFYIHGGGFVQGDKAEAVQGNYRSTGVSDLLAAGFVVASLNYRLAPTYPLPAQIEDVKCAVRYFRTSAATYSIDPARIGAWGGSAGAHLAAMLAVADSSAGWDVGEYLDQSSRVQAALPAYGPMDFATLPAGSEAEGASIFGPGWTQDTLVQLSPITYVTPDDPPIFLQHGLADATVPYTQSQEMFNALQAAPTGYSQLELVPGGDHGFVTNKSNPTPTELGHQAAAFFKQFLG